MFRTLAWLPLFLSSAVLAAPLYDPTQPGEGAPVAASAEPAAVQPLKASFVVISADRRLARINGVWVSEGDRVRGARVIRITRGAVTLRQDQRVLELPVGGAGVDKRPARGAAEK